MKSSAARTIVAIILSVTATASVAGIPVVDIPQTIQSTITAMQQVAQSAKQIEQYRTQLQQLEFQMRNTAGVDDYLWDRSQSVMDNLIRTTDTIRGHINAAGSLQAYIDQFGDVGDYRNIGCFKEGGCKEKMGDLYAAGSASQKQAGDAAVRGIQRQQDQLQVDATYLDQLKNGAEGADGQLKALQYANQFAGEQSAQLLQIRSLLVQQNAVATAKLRAENSRRSLQRAADEYFLGGDYVKTKHKRY